MKNPWFTLFFFNKVCPCVILHYELNYSYNSIILVDYKSRRETLPYEVSPLRPSFLFGEHFEELLGGDISAPAPKQKKTSAHSYDIRPNMDYSHAYTDLSELSDLEEV